MLKLRNVMKVIFMRLVWAHVRSRMYCFPGKAGELMKYGIHKAMLCDTQLTITYNFLHLKI